MAVADAVPSDQSLFDRRRTRGTVVRRFVRTQPLGTLGALVIILIGAGAVFAPWLNTVDPTEFSRDVLLEPSSDHWFGTTREGRDVYSRVLYGARVSLLVGVATVGLSLVGGTVIGLAAGYARGFVDTAISRVADILIAFPSILFALTLATSFGSGLRTVVVSIAIIFTPVIMRIMRGAVLQESAKPYVEAARVIGASEGRVMLRHVLPNLAGLAIVTASATLPAAILTESALSFLGVGVPVGDPSWGGDLSGNARQFFTQAWWIAVFPGAALSISVLAFNLLGDSLAETLDPRLRGVRNV